MLKISKFLFIIGVGITVLGCPQITQPEADSALQLTAPKGLPKKITVSEKAGNYVGSFEYSAPFVTYTLSGEDGYKFYINSGGVVFFKSPPDYEKQNIYSFTVEIYDGNKGKLTHDVSVEVKDIVDEKSVPYPPTKIAITNEENDEPYSTMQPVKSVKTLTALKAYLPSSIDASKVDRVSFFDRNNNYTLADYTHLGDVQNVSGSSVTFNRSVGFEEGNYMFVAQIILKDGKKSSYSDPLILSVDRSAPSAATDFIIATKKGIVAEDVSEITDPLLYLSAKAEPNTTVTFYSIYNSEDPKQAKPYARRAGSNGIAKYDFIYNLPNGAYIFYTQVSDAAGNKSPQSSQRKILLIDSSYSPPKFRSKIPAEISVKEGSSLSIPGDFQGTDGDKNDLKYSLDGPDKELFTYKDGILSFNFYPDYEEKSSAASSNEYELKLILKDIYGNMETHDLKIIIEDVEDDDKLLAPLGLRLFGNTKSQYIKQGEKIKYNFISFEVFAPRGSTVNVYYTVQGSATVHKLNNPLDQVKDHETKFKSGQDKPDQSYHPIQDQENTVTFYAKASQSGKGESDASALHTVTIDDKKPESPKGIIIRTATTQKDVTDDSTAEKSITIKEPPISFEATLESQNDLFAIVVTDSNGDRVFFQSKANTGTLKKVIRLADLKEDPFLEDPFLSDGIKKTGTYTLVFSAIDETGNFNQLPHTAVKLNIE